MTTELKQKKLLRRKEFRIHNDRLYYKNKNLFKSFELEIPYDDITNQVIREKWHNLNLWFAAGFVFIVLMIKTYNLFTAVEIDYGVYLFTLTLFLVLVIISYFTSYDSIFIKATNPQLIEIYRTKPTEVRVNEFTNALYETSKKYLLEKYVFNSALYPDQKKHYAGVLRDLHFIKDDEFEKITLEINSNSTGGNPIGFKTKK